MKGFDTIYWLPTYLSRETEGQTVLTPEDLSIGITSPVIVSDMNDELWNSIKKERDAGKLVLIMGAGSIDSWIRSNLSLKTSPS
jgi:UDP-N-acetylmuramate-alanine ligase